MNGLRAYQTGSVALGSVAHVKRIAVRQVRRDVAGVGDREYTGLPYPVGRGIGRL